MKNPLIHFCKKTNLTQEQAIQLYNTCITCQNYGQFIHQLKLYNQFYNLQLSYFVVYYFVHRYQKYLNWLREGKPESIN